MSMSRIDWIDLALQIIGMCIVLALLAMFTPDGVPRMVDAPGSYVLALCGGIIFGYCLRWVFGRIQRKRPL